MCWILVLVFDMGNVVYGSFAIEALSIVNTLFFNLLDFVSLCDSELCIQNNQPS